MSVRESLTKPMQDARYRMQDGPRCGGARRQGAASFKVDFLREG